MYLCLWLFFATTFLIVFLKFASNLIAESSKTDRENFSSYECGFEHRNASRIPFSLRYFLLTLLFLLFDLEVIFLIFSPQLFRSNYEKFSFCMIIVFISFLIFSLLYEWYDGTLEWIK